MKTVVTTLAILSLATAAVAGDFPVLEGGYFGQPLPGDEAELFAPGWISTEFLTRDIAMMPDGSEIYFCMATAGYGIATIVETRLVDGHWTRPEIAPFARTPGQMNIEPAISPDGQRFLFLSTRAMDGGEPGSQDIWAMDREGDHWGEPYNLGSPVNTDAPEFYPSLTNDGTLYFTRADPETRIHYIYRSRLVEGEYTEPEQLPEQVNCGRNRFNAFVAPDESFVIVPVAGMEDTLGGVDYYITFRNEADEWTEPLNMGEPINSADGNEWSAQTSPDGRVLFFMSARMPDDEVKELSIEHIRAMQSSPLNGTANIWWTSADLIDDLRTKAYEGE